MQKITLKISKPALYIVIILVAAAAVFSVIELSRVYEKYSWKKSTRELAEAKLNGEVNRIQKIILSIQQIPLNLAYVLEFSKPKKEHMEILLNSVIANSDELFGVCIAFEPNLYDKDLTNYAPYLYKKDGKIVSADPTDSTYHYFSMDWYLIPKTLQKSVWIEPYFDEGEGGGNIIMSTYSAPFYSFDGEKETLNGIVSVDISLDWLSKIVSSIKLGDEGYSLLVSESGSIISAPNPQWPYNESIFSLADENNLPVLREVGRDLHRGKSGFVNIGKIGSGRDWWVCYKPIPANNWGVLLFVPEK